MMRLWPGSADNSSIRRSETGPAFSVHTPATRHWKQMRQDPDFFGEKELSLIYIAKRLKDALRLEKALTDGGVDYLVETDTYSGGIIFRSQRTGAFF